MEPTAFADTDAALLELRDLLSESYALTGEFPDWSVTLLEHWYYSGRSARVREKPDFWRRSARLWWGDGGKLIGFCASDSSGDPVFVVSHPSHRRVEESIFGWLAEEWLSTREKVTVLARTDDEPRQETLRRLGFVERGEAERRYRYDLAAMSLEYTLPEGFVVRGMGESGDLEADCARQAELTRLIFPRSEYDAAAHASLRQAPDYSPRLDLAALTPAGDHVALAAAMLDVPNRVAEFEPVGTHPEYRRLGLARAVVFEAFARLRDLGVRQAFISTGGEPYHANRFYSALGPTEVLAKSEWVKTRQ